MAKSSHVKWFNSESLDGMGRRKCDQLGGSGVPMAVSMGAMSAPSTRSTGNGLSSLDASVLGLRRMGERNMSFSRGASWGPSGEQ